MIDTKHKILFDDSQCIGCKQCYKACFVDVIRWDETQKKPVFKYAEDCEHCFYCESVCKKGCITVVPDYGSEHLKQNFDRYQ